MSSEATEDAQPAAVPPAEPASSAAEASEASEAAEAAESDRPETAAAAEAAGGSGGVEGLETSGDSKTAKGPETAGGLETAGGPETIDASETAESREPVELPEPAEPPELIGLAEPVESARWGRGVALAALFTVAGLAIIGGAIAVIGALTHGFHKPVTIKYRESAVFKLHAGDCVNTPDGQVVSVLPCSAPHQAEVFATFSLPASAWPGTAKVRADASSGCASRLTGYLNPQLAISLSQSYVFPNQVAWTAGTRTVICEVRATSGNLTGSVRGASAG